MEKKTDLRIARTYLFLHNAFTELLEEKRFEDFTVNELCERAMIRRTTFYKHFADKYEYFSFYVREIVASFQEQLSPGIMEDSPKNYLEQMIRELVRFLNEHERMVRNVCVSNMFPLLMSALLEQISEDVRQVLHRANPGSAANAHKLDGCAAFLSGGLLNTLFQNVKSDAPIDEDQFISVIACFLEMPEWA